MINCNINTQGQIKGIPPPHQPNGRPFGIILWHPFLANQPGSFSKPSAHYVLILKECTSQKQRDLLVKTFQKVPAVQKVLST